MANNTELDYYEVVGVSHTADSNEIRTAYRKASLKVHPDRNPDDPLAADKFHALNTAFEILLDPTKRSAFDAKRASQLARAARFAGLDNKRKQMTRDLEAREEAYRTQQASSSNLDAKKRKLEELKAAGAKLRQAKEAKINADQNQTQLPNQAPLSSSHVKSEPAETSKQPSNATHCSPSPNPLDTLQCTLRFRWHRKKIPALTSSDTLAALIDSSDGFSSSDVESILLAPPKPRNDQSTSDTNKKLSALVCFKSIDTCERFFRYTQTAPAWTNFTITQMASIAQPCEEKSGR